MMPIEYEVERDVVEYLGAHYSIEPDQITDESTLEDLGLDSLAVLAIADIIENKYGISLDDGQRSVHVPSPPPSNGFSHARNPTSTATPSIIVISGTSVIPISAAAPPRAALAPSWV